LEQAADFKSELAAVSISEPVADLRRNQQQGDLGAAEYRSQGRRDIGADKPVGLAMVDAQLLQTVEVAQ
jgi:hypothetical protein